MGGLGWFDSRKHAATSSCVALDITQAISIIICTL